MRATTWIMAASFVPITMCWSPVLAQGADISGSVEWPSEWVVFVAEAHRPPPLPDEHREEVPENIEVEGETLQAVRVSHRRNQYDFAGLFGEIKAGRTAYVFLPIESDEAQEVTLGFGADWWMQAWLNGEKIIDTTQRGNLGAPPSIHDHTAKVRLRAGRTILSVRFISGSGSAILALGGPDELRKGDFIPLAFEPPAPEIPEPENEVFSGIRYVAVDGDDEKPGTAEEPWGSIQYAVNHAAPGATIRLGPGVFRETVVILRSGADGKPITLEGARGDHGERLTRIDIGTTVDPATWSPAPQVGPNVYRNATLDRERLSPGLLMIDGLKAAHVHKDRHHSARFDPVEVTNLRDQLVARRDVPHDDPQWRSMGMTVLSWPEDHRMESWYVTREHPEVTAPFWKTIGAVYVHDPREEGVTYLRMAGGADPRDHNISVSAGGTVIKIHNAAFIRLHGMDIAGGEYGIVITGTDATHNVVEDCHITHGRTRVHITGSASHNTIRNCSFTMGFYGSGQPGAWAGGHKENHAVKDFLYNYFKYLHASASSSDDTSISISTGAHNVHIENNDIGDGLIGVNITNANNVHVRDNIIRKQSSTGMTISYDSMDIFVAGNTFYDCSINIRLHRLNQAKGIRAYIYRNRLGQPDFGVGNHIFCHALDGMEIYTDPQIMLYHNSFARGGHGFTLNTLIRGLRDGHFINNVFDTKSNYAQPRNLVQDKEAVRTFAYNWLNSDPDQPPAWFGPNNIFAKGERIWGGDGVPDFRLPDGHAARRAGIDLSRPFTINGKEYGPLPGMAPGYFEGDRPDMGAIQMPERTD